MLGQWRKLFNILEYSSLQSVNNFGQGEGVEFELQSRKAI
jgi:hypothetical protein